MRLFFYPLLLALAGTTGAAVPGGSGMGVAAPGGPGVGVAAPAMVPQPGSADDLMRDAVAAFQRKEFAAARGLFRRLAEQGDATAETLLGTMALNGEGGTRDEAVAAAWFLRAARRGYAPAQLALSDSFARGRGVPRDMARARALALAAAVQGQPGAAEAAARLSPERYAMLARR